MAQDIRLHTGALRHPKSLQLKASLGSDAVLCLIELWCFTATYHSKGVLVGMDKGQIALASGWPTERAGEFVDTLVELRLLDHRRGRYEVHGWKDTQPWAYHADSRKQRAAASASKKWGSNRKAHATRSKRMADARRKGTHTKEDWDILRLVCGDICCRCASHERLLIKDHIEPIYRGGSDSIENIQPLCQKCNSSKGREEKDFRPKDWRFLVDAERMRRAGISQASTARRMHAPSPSPSPSPSPKPLPTPKPDPNPTAEDQNLPALRPRGPAGDAPPWLKGFTDRALKEWRARGGDGEWTKGDFAAIAGAAKGYHKHDPEKAESRLWASWLGFLDDTFDGYSGHYPRQWGAKASTWPKRGHKGLMDSIRADDWRPPAMEGGQ